MEVHLPSEKSILPYFSGPRGVAISVPFPEVRNRKGTESGLGGGASEESPRKEQKWEHSEPQQKKQIRGNKERRRRIDRSEEEGHLKEIWESASYGEGGSTGY